MEAIMQPIKTFLAFLRAETWADARNTVKQHQAVLLDEKNEGFYNILINSARNHHEAHQVLNVHLEILRQCRVNGVEPTFDRFPIDQPKPRLPTDFDLSKALDVWLDQMLETLLGPLGKMMRRMFEDTIDVNNLPTDILPDPQEVAKIANDIDSHPENAPDVINSTWSRLSVQLARLKDVTEQLFSGNIQHDPEIKETIEELYTSIERHLEGLVDAESWELTFRLSGAAGLASDRPVGYRQGAESLTEVPRWIVPP